MSTRGKKVEIECHYCKRLFKRIPSTVKIRNFCSKQCFDKWQKESKYNQMKKSPCWKPRIEKVCKQCKNKFKIQRFFDKRKFCSYKCYLLWQTEHTGKEHFNSKKKIKCMCNFCGKQYELIPSLYKKGTKFCSSKCKQRQMKEHTGKSNPRWVDKVSIVCKQCKKEFLVVPSQKNIAKFCTMDCYSKWKSENLTGENSYVWKGGSFPYYGRNWILQRKKVLERACYKSELSGKSNTRLEVHHIFSLRAFQKKYIDLCIKPYINNLKLKSFNILPHTLISNVIYNEANRFKNLILLTQQEHHKFEDMPATFFEACREENGLLA